MGCGSSMREYESDKQKNARRKEQPEARAVKIERVTLEHGRAVETLGRKVARRACTRGDAENCRRTAEVNQLEAQLRVVGNHEHVLRLQIAMHEVEAEELLARGTEQLRERHGLIGAERAR